MRGRRALVPAAAELRELCVRAAAAAGVRDGHIALQFVDSEKIAALNARYRGKAAPTDVLSFPVDGADALAGGVERELGDVVICAQLCGDVRVAIVHGVLHLAGFDHETDDGEMLALQRSVLDEPRT
ncbi:MAG TPA: rRNA maturation RNase YbeY [Solirubrobacteraceae bacterium]|nr:rRNA maturation RNase YbeY [Solirubrobacteraceae bacterium]